MIPNTTVNAIPTVYSCLLISALQLDVFIIHWAPNHKPSANAESIEKNAPPNPKPSKSPCNLVPLAVLAKESSYFFD